jgi:hypothetical protein
MSNFFAELKRRNVYRAAVAYGVVAWFLTQLTTQFSHFLKFRIPQCVLLSLHSRSDSQSRCYSPGFTNLPPKGLCGQGEQNC